MARFGTGNLCDLTASFERIFPQLKASLHEIIATGDFILGRSVIDLEKRLAEHFGANHCVTVANGTDALKLSLLAAGASRRSLVLCPSFTFQASANAILDTSAALAFVDVDLETMVINANTLEQTVNTINLTAYDRLFLLGVDLFGLPCGTRELEDACVAFGIELIFDAAQSLGARVNGRFGVSGVKFACTSFFPSKPLGTLGDGGAIFCRDESSASHLRSLRNHGVQDYGLLAVQPGFNSRLDSIHAAALLLLLDHERSDYASRRAAMAEYRRILEPYGLTVQAEPAGQESACSSMTLRAGDARDQWLKWLRQKGIECQVFYRYPLHKHPAFANAINADELLPNSIELARTVLSLPMHPFLDAAFFVKLEEVLARGP